MQHKTNAVPVVDSNKPRWWCTCDPCWESYWDHYSRVHFPLFCTL